MSSNENSPGEVLAAILIALIAMIPLIALEGAILSKGWEWFVVYHFHVATMPFAIAIGIATMLNFATFQRTAVVRREETNVMLAVLTDIFTSLFLCGAFWFQMWLIVTFLR